MVKFLDLQKITALYSDEINRAIERTINSGWFLNGVEVQLFEKEYAHYIGTNRCVS